MAKKLKIAARTEGFRRAGFEFGSTPVVIETNKLTEAQIKSLQSEPQLVVVEFSGDDVPAPAGTNDPAALAQARAEAASATKALKDAESKLAETEKKLADAESKLKAAQKK